LRARLRSYVGKNNGMAPKTRSLLKEATVLSWQTLGSETEALIKEAELIKKYLPKYNVLMRDDKQYFYVGFTRSTDSGQAKEAFPKIFVTHRPQRPTNYIGPFTEGAALQSVLNTLRKNFPYCTCKKEHKVPCLNSRIGRCVGFCCLTSSPTLLLRKEKGVRSEMYQKNIAAIKKVLSGKNKSLTKDLKKEMRALSRAQKYEEAGKTRNQIRALEKIFEHRGVVGGDFPSDRQKALQTLASLLKLKNIHRIEAYDIANIQGKFAYGSMAVFTDGIPEKSMYRIFKIRSSSTSDDPKMLREVLSRRLTHREWPMPDVILVDGGKAQLGAVSPPYEGGARGGFKIIALTKNEKHIGDRLLIAERKEPLALSSLPQSLAHLLLHLDTEAHRFAIKHYRKAHRKSI